MRNPSLFDARRKKIGDKFAPEMYVVQWIRPIESYDVSLVRIP